MSDLSRIQGDFASPDITGAEASRAWAGRHAAFLQGKLDPLQIRNPAADNVPEPEGMA